MPALKIASLTVNSRKWKRFISWSLIVTLKKWKVSVEATFKIPSGVAASGDCNAAGIFFMPSTLSGLRTATRSSGKFRASATSLFKFGDKAPPPTNSRACGGSLPLSSKIVLAMAFAIIPTFSLIGIKISSAVRS